MREDEQRKQGINQAHNRNRRLNHGVRVHLQRQKNNNTKGGTINSKLPVGHMSSAHCRSCIPQIPYNKEDEQYATESQASMGGLCHRCTSALSAQHRCLLHLRSNNMPGAAVSACIHACVRCTKADGTWKGSPLPTAICIHTKQPAWQH